MLLGEVKLVLDDPCSGSPDIRGSIENINQSNVWIAQTGVFGIRSKETTKLGFVIEGGLEGFIEGDWNTLWKGGDSGDESLCFRSLGHVTDVGGLGRQVGRDQRIYAPGHAGVLGNKSRLPRVTSHFRYHPMAGCVKVSDRVNR